MPVARIYTAATPFNDVELFDTTAAESNDLFYMAHWDHAPGKLQRFDHDNWLWSDLTFGPDIVAPSDLAVTVDDPEHDGGDWAPEEHSYKISGVSLDSNQESLPSAAVLAAENDLSYPANTNTLEWTADPIYSRYIIYKAENGIYGYIGGTTGNTFIDDNIFPDLSNTPQEQRNPFEDDGDDLGNRPGVVFLYEQRLGFARTRNNPNGMWLSQSSNYENMNISTPQKASDAISLRIVGRPGNYIQSVAPAKELLTLTVGSIYTIDGGNNGYLSPTPPPVVHPGPNRGTSKVPPIVLDDLAFTIQALGSKVKTVGFTYETEGYKGNDLTIWARHLFKNRTIVDWCFTEEPNSCFWFVFADGGMVCLTWLAEQALLGMTVIETDGLIESCCTVPEQGEHKVYLLVRRTINGVQKRYVERMASTEWEDKEDAIFLDSAVTYDGEPATGLSGLFHLEGRTVSALVDGNVVEGLVVENGRLEHILGGDDDNPRTFRKAHVGIPYDQLIETLPVPGTVQGYGSVTGRRQTTTKAVVDVVESKGFQVAAGPEREGLTTIYYDPIGEELDTWGAAAELYTGLLEANVEVNWSDGQSTVIIRQTLPLPLTVVGVYPDMDITE